LLLGAIGACAGFLLRAPLARRNCFSPAALSIASSRRDYTPLEMMRDADLLADVPS
jgi:hypothetical protein